MAVLGATHDHDDPWGLDVVEAKVRPPRLRPGAVDRSELLARLDGAARHIVVRAPAGYGKTTLARQWVECLDRPVAWLSLDAGDDDPVVLFRHLVAALASVGGAPTARAVALRPAAWNASPALAAVAHDLEAAGPLVLVIDDVHEVTSPEVHAFLDRLLDAAPPAVTVTMLTRAEPGARRQRRLLDGSLVEIGVDDLRLDATQSTTLLRAAAPDLECDVVDTAVARCEGWPAGLALVGLALAGTPDARRVASGLSLADRPVAEYLRDEVLRGLDPATRSFMVRSSLLTTLDAPLCDAVLERAGSHEVLETLACSGNLFVAGLDDGGTSYRYHHLWRELLLAELRASAPEDERALRRRAAEWLEAHDRIDDAVPQWLAAGEPATATRLVAASLNRYLITGRVATLQRWLGGFTADEVQADPTLGLTAAWVATFTGTAEETGRWLARLATWAPDTLLADGTPLGPARAAAELVSGVGGTKAGIRAADVVVDAGPDNPWWATARVLGTVARGQVGLLDDPDAALRDAERDVAAVPPLEALVRAHRAWFHLRAGRMSEARALADAGARAIAAAGLDEYLAYVVVSAVQAAVQARAPEPAVAWEAIERVTRLLGEGRSFSTRGRIFGHLLLADALLTLDASSEAAGHLAIASTLADTEPDLVRLHDYADDLAARLEVLAGAGLVEPLSAAELRVLRELPTHHSLREIAESLFVSRNTVKTQTIAIYRKLGVSGRSDAVRRARDLGLLTG